MDWEGDAENRKQKAEAEGAATGEPQGDSQEVSAAHIDDAHFLTWPVPDDRWVNMPADRHGQAGVLSYANGVRSAQRTTLLNSAKKIDWHFSAAADIHW